jgi:hypothetical protein
MSTTLKKLAAAGAAGLLAVTLVACSGEDAAPVDPASVDVATDLETARDAVVEAMGYGTYDQVMLASDVDGPTQKYGLMVMPFVKTDAAARVTGTVNIDGEDFVIEAESAETGTTWQIDQDGTITEKTE